jgi:uncharacterized phiE125 gp8 family phage protein
MLRLSLPPSSPPVSIAEAKDNMGVTISTDDALILSMIAAATGEAEHLMGRAIMPQKWMLTLDEFEDEIFLDRPPVTAIDSVQYAHWITGVLTTLDPSAYQLVLGDYRASVVPAWSTTWPSARATRSAIQILFSCGYADAASVPEDIKGWIKMQATTYYNNRSTVRSGRDYASQKMPDADRLLDRYKVWSL